MKRLLFLAAVAAVFVMTAAAADISGKWTAETPGRDGQTYTSNFDLKQDGEALTGTVSMRSNESPISDGKVSGDSVSFKLKVEFNGNSMVFLYDGKISGNEIKFTRKREGSDRVQEFTAKKAS